MSQLFSRPYGYVFVVLLVFGIASCGRPSQEELNQGLALFKEYELDEALPHFEEAVSVDPENPEAHVWLAETQRRLGNMEEAVKSARRALELDPCNSFAHTVLGDAYNVLYSSWEQANPDSAWRHLLKAVECDSADGNAWFSIWPQTIRRGNDKVEKRSFHALMNTGFLTPSILAYNRWVLRDLPPHAILLTNGDMDTYPALALQEVEGLRDDVVIVNKSLLNTTWYAKHIRDRYGVQLPFSDQELETLRAFYTEDTRLVLVSDQILRGWMGMRAEGALPRPIAIANTIADLGFASGSEDHLVQCGAYQIWLPEPADSDFDTELVQKSLERVDPEEFMGPFVGEMDRSPLRLQTVNLVTNISGVALRCAEQLIEAGQPEEALELIEWAEGFEKVTPLGLTHGEAFDAVAQVAKEAM
jgi:tetratricopeptide (TPR) repeat protein